MAIPCTAALLAIATMSATVVIVLGVLALSGWANGDYLIGTGRYDVTGPAAEIEMVRETLHCRLI